MPYRRNWTSERIENARRLRRECSAAERAVWERLRKKRLGFKFRRQHTIGPYVADFYCCEAKVALELDGQQHNAEADRYRDAYFAGLGIATFRVPNTELFAIDDHVVRDWTQELHSLCESRVGSR